jgi:hypothetical protein
MKIVDLLEGAEKSGTTLGGFPVKVLHIQDSGQPEIDEEGVAEGSEPNREAGKAIQNLKNLALMKSALTSQQLVQAGRESILTDAIKACIQFEQSYLQNKQQGNAIFVRALRDEIDNFRKGYPINTSMPEDTTPELGDLLQGKLGKVNFQQGVAEGQEHLDRIRKLSGLDEALKIDAPQQAWSKQDMQDYATRIKTGTKTKQDRFKPIIHGSNIKAITKDDGGEEWDLDDLAKQITTRPRAILGTNAKMAKSKKEGAITYDLTLPALSGIVVDEDTGEFVEIITCPGAGECQNYCYARKGGYVMFPASSMSAAQALNFLVNHPTDYMKMFDGEVKKAKALADKNGIKLLVRIHDAGDFFSKEYYNLVMGVKADNPGVTFYFYTKMGDIASADQPDDVIGQFSPGAKSREVKAVQAARAAGKHVKDAVTLPKDMFRDLFVTDAKGKYVKDDQGRTQVKSSEVWSEFQRKLAAEYKIDPESIITYDQMNKIPEPESTGTKDQLQKDGTIKQVPVYPPPKWNVVIFPAGHGDVGAARRDVSKQFLMFH